jgi:hypothetical protein
VSGGAGRGAFAAFLYSNSKGAPTLWLGIRPRARRAFCLFSLSLFVLFCLVLSLFD